MDLNTAYRKRDIDVLRYPQTGRPITDMPFAGNNCVRGDDYLPVVRYESLYYSQETLISDVCGTFYFYEPDSSNYLHLGKRLIAANKVDAILKLEGYPNGLPYIFDSTLNPFTLTFIPSLSITAILTLADEFRENWDYDYKYKYLTDPRIVTREQDEIISDLDLITKRIRDIETYFRTLLQSELDIDSNYIRTDNGSINSVYKELYNLRKHSKYQGNRMLGEFDYLDQPICKLANEQGYDTIILQREPGETRAVTEILDVRSRRESYQNICKTNIKFDIPTTQHPTIWYRNDGFLVLE